MTNSFDAADGSQMSPTTEQLQDEVAELERQLGDAKARLRARNGGSGIGGMKDDGQIQQLSKTLMAGNAHHHLLILSDSALPLGSFAFSSGLESYLAHNSPSETSFPHFLTLSLASYASTTLPFVLAAFRSPSTLLDLDDGLDAAIMCTVGRRASVAQGRALLGVWERSLLPSLSTSSMDGGRETITVLKLMSTLVRKSAENDVPHASAHLPPLFGALARILGLTAEQTAYVYLLSHVKALLSAAVRASIFGPYQAQKVLASEGVQDGIRREVERNWQKRWEEAGQEVPVLDLWIGRHELLYSRIFNS